MAFNSLDFLVFFPIVALAYYIIPHRFRYIWLLAASYYFYMNWNPKYAILLFLSTAITYISGIAMEKVKSCKWDEAKKTKYKKLCVAGSFLLNLGILGYFKYAQFFLNNINGFLKFFHINSAYDTIDILLPVGISFYTFQALGYTMDVYRNEISAEKNFLKYALFVSFFPQLVAGPIERSKNLLFQLNERHYFDLKKIREGLLIMLWGFFLKLVMADRIAIFVDNVYDGGFEGWYLIVATMLFAIQIYCDFNGYTMIARGAAEVMGFSLMENFDAPYLSSSVGEFWRRWHISLTSWFRDYLYVPLGGNRKGKYRKYLNILIVFTVSGLWHGASWSFVVWGVLNGVYQVTGAVLKPFRDRVIKFLGLNRESIGHKILNCITTFFLVDFAWIFFRSGSFTGAIRIIRSIFTSNNMWILFDRVSLYQCGLDEYDFRLMLLTIVILFLADMLKKNNVKVIDVIVQQDMWCRWAVYIISFLFVFFLGIWGSGYDADTFIYFQF